MEQFIVLFVILVFENGEVKTQTEAYPSLDACQQVEGFYWSQTAEAYAESKVIGMFTECLNIVPRKVNDD